MTAPDPNRPWAVGDLAVCIAKPPFRWEDHTTGKPRQSTGPKPGEILRVDDVCAPCPLLDGHVGLGFAEYPLHFHTAAGFRRIEPDATPADDAELIERIRRCGAQVPA